MNKVVQELDNCEDGRILSLSHETPCKVVKIPREYLHFCKDDDTLNKNLSYVYILLGKVKNQKAVYIGISNVRPKEFGIYERLKEESSSNVLSKNKFAWNTILTLCATNGLLTNKEASQLESMFYHWFSENTSFIVVNERTPSSTNPDAISKYYFNQFKNLIDAIDYNLLHYKCEKPITHEEHCVKPEIEKSNCQTLHYKGLTMNAMVNPETNQVVLLKGSDFSKTETKCCPASDMRKKYKHCQKDGKLIKNIPIRGKSMMHSLRLAYYFLTGSSSTQGYKQWRN